MNAVPSSLQIVHLVPTWARKFSSYFLSLWMNVKADGSFGDVFPFLFSFGSVRLSRWNTGLGRWLPVSSFSSVASLFRNFGQVSLAKSTMRKIGLQFLEDPSHVPWARYAPWRVFSDKARSPASCFLCLQVHPGSPTSHPLYRNECSTKEYCKQQLLPTYLACLN